MQRILALLVALAVVASSCSDDTDDASDSEETTTTTQSTTTIEATTTSSATTTTTEPPPFVADVTPRECAITDETESECWWVTVPVHHDDPTGPTYALSVTQLVSPSADPGPPVIYLSGGPGGRGGNPFAWAESPMREDRDVYVWDQRGTGDSEPDTECPEGEESVVALLQFAKPLEEELADRTAAMEACRQRFLDAGVDLTSFSTPHSAADLAIIREALGIEAWHLFGVSYGTRLSLESMRSHPEGIVTTILDSAYPSTTGGAGLYRAVGERVFDELVATCAATDCSIANPDLAADLAFIREEYNENPIELTGEVFGEERTFQITGDDVMGGLFNAMYDTSLIPVIPSVIGQFADGDTTLTREFLDSGLDRLVGSAEGMGWATDCADNGNRSTPDEFDAASRDAEAFTLIAMVAPGGMCHAFPVPPVDPAFNEPVDARIPALVLGGSLDPITPPENVQEVAQHLDFAFPIVWPQVGHGVIFADDCAMELAVQWLRESGEAKNVECLVDRDDRAPWQPIVDG